MPSEDFWEGLPGHQTKKTKPKQKLDHRSLDDVVTQSEEEAREKPVQRSQGARRFLLVLVTLILMALGGIAGLSLWAVETVRLPVDADSTESVLFVVESGTSARAVAGSLEDQGLILSMWPFLAYIQATNQTVLAGTYLLSPSQSMADIARELATGETNEYRVTFPEGWRVEQMAELLDQMGIVAAADFQKAATYDPVLYSLPPGIARAPGDSLEGLLFPDTYRFAYGATSKEIVSRMLDNFSVRTETLKPTYAQVILASIIEREARLPEDRPKMAGVYQNRLKNNIRLEADPTVQYAKETILAAASDEATFPWWQPITVADYQAVDSVYNTYRTTGLPPTPIANPGLKSLEAAVNPSSHEFFFFFNLADGSTIYSGTLDEHNANKVKHGLGS